MLYGSLCRLHCHPSVSIVMASRLRVCCVSAIQEVHQLGIQRTVSQRRQLLLVYTLWKDAREYATAKCWAPIWRPTGSKRVYLAKWRVQNLSKKQKIPSTDLQLNWIEKKQEKVTWSQTQMHCHTNVMNQLLHTVLDRLSRFRTVRLTLNSWWVCASIPRHLHCMKCEAIGL